MAAAGSRVPKVDFLFAVKVLRRRFRTVVGNALRLAYADGTLVLPVHLDRDATALDLLLAQASRTDWHAYVKPPFGGAEHVLAYLAAYTHKTAISNRRLLSFDGESVTFSWRDYAHGNQQKTMSLSAVEFLRRFSMHIRPPRFTLIRYYGFLANRVRAANLELARQLLGCRRAPREVVRYAPLCPPPRHHAPRRSHRPLFSDH